MISAPPFWSVSETGKKAKKTPKRKHAPPPNIATRSTSAKPTNLPTQAPITSIGTKRPEAKGAVAAQAAPQRCSAAVAASAR